jgi:DNA-binding CsgD family transcriptional regulator
MLIYLVYIVFIFSVAFAAGGIVLSSRLRNRYKTDIFSTLMYFQVFIFTFGFYGIWGRVVIKAFLSGYISVELLSRFTDFSTLLGLPFLVFAWFMLIKFSRDITGRKNTNRQTYLFLFLNFIVIFVFAYFIVKENGVKPLSLVKYYFIGMNLIFSVIASIYFLLPVKRNAILHNYDKRIIASATIMAMVVQSLTLYFYSSQHYIGLVFIFTFFAGNSFLPVYLSYGMLLSAFFEEPIKDISFDEFCKKYFVSPRESDIVKEICNGLSNKEISEKLFISLQTVKDHTHRIYVKINVRSRVQLINLVKEVKGL